jgi:hypothetical protein
MTFFAIERCEVIVLPGQEQDRASIARACFQRSFVDQAGGDPQIADQLRREFYADLGRRSGAVRRLKAAARAAARDDAQTRWEIEMFGHPLPTEADLAKLLQEIGR